MEEEKKKKKFGQGLVQFLKEYSVIGLAIGIIVGQASKDLVDAIVKGIFTPLIDLITPGDKFQNLQFYLQGVKFDVGIIVNSFLTFLIVMIFLYIVVKKILKKEELIKKK